MSSATENQAQKRAHAEENSDDAVDAKSRKVENSKGVRLKFCFNTYLILLLKQCQRSIFKLRECAQSIPRIKLPLYGSILEKMDDKFT
jgi:hypothetical protein